MRVGSPFPLSEFWGLNSGHKAWWPSAFTTEMPHQHQLAPLVPSGVLGSPPLSDGKNQGFNKAQSQPQEVAVLRVRTHLSGFPSFSYLQMWQKIEDAEWRPQTYLELEGLPCILIFSGMDPHGESLPR